MKAFVFALVLFAATSVFGQNPYEYVDDELIQKVGQIVYEYDQQVAASRAGGAANSNFAASRSFNNDVSGGYQFGRPERVARVNNNFGYAPQQQQQQVRSRLPQSQYNQVQQQSYVRPQQQYNNYQVSRNQRQLVSPVQTTVPQSYNNYQAPVPVNRAYQVPRPVSRTYEAPVQVDRTYQAPRLPAYQQPVAPVLRTQQEPQVAQQQQQVKNAGFSAYFLSQPEVVARVAEFHYTDGQETSDDKRDSVKVGVTGVQENGGFRLA